MNTHHNPRARHRLATPRGEAPRQRRGGRAGLRGWRRGLCGAPRGPARPLPARRCPLPAAGSAAGPRGRPAGGGAPARPRGSVPVLGVSPPGPGLAPGPVPAGGGCEWSAATPIAALSTWSLHEPLYKGGWKNERGSALGDLKFLNKLSSE